MTVRESRAGEHNAVRCEQVAACAIGEDGEHRARLTQPRSTACPASLLEAKSWSSKPGTVQNTAPVWLISELLAERLRAREEEMLAVDLEARNRGLPLRARDPVDERLSKIVLHIRVLSRVHQDDPILRGGSVCLNSSVRWAKWSPAGFQAAAACGSRVK